MRIIGVDPSGSFNEGKGVTGIYILQSGTPLQAVTVHASDHNSRLEYWAAVLHTIQLFAEEDCIISMEDYVLYASSAKAQINSNMETSKLIGAIEMFAYTHSMPVMMRNASQVKKRWTNEILEFNGYITVKNGRAYAIDGSPINPHALDALRHAVHCHTFELKKKG